MITYFGSNSTFIPLKAGPPLISLSKVTFWKNTDWYSLFTLVSNEMDLLIIPTSERSQPAILASKSLHDSKSVRAVQFMPARMPTSSLLMFRWVDTVMKSVVEVMYMMYPWGIPLDGGDQHSIAHWSPVCSTRTFLGAATGDPSFTLW